jgi:glycosyltransferase involved in cell wall biosynthesis
MSISVCIPTFRRRELLLEAVRSTFSNDTRPIEVIVSDDDCDPEVERLLASLSAPLGIAIRYVPNQCIKGQGGNVRNAFAHANGDAVSLMHDDDYYLPHGLDRLYSALAGSADVAAVYGRQFVVSEDGIEDKEKTEAVYRSYFKGDAYVGKQDPIWATLAQQFPNNSWLARRSLIRDVDFPLEIEVGFSPVDFYFGVRLGLASDGSFEFIPDHVACYRLSATSVLRTRRKLALESDHLGYRILREFVAIGPEQEAALALARSRYIAPAVRAHISRGEGREAIGAMWQNRFCMNVSLAGKVRLTCASLLALLGLRAAAVKALDLDYSQA